MKMPKEANMGLKASLGIFSFPIYSKFITCSDIFFNMSREIHS